MMMPRSMESLVSLTGMGGPWVVDGAILQAWAILEIQRDKEKKDLQKGGSPEVALASLCSRDRVQRRGAGGRMRVAAFEPTGPERESRRGRSSKERASDRPSGKDDE